MHYLLEEVDTEGKAEELRKIRNECRLYMTNNTGLISPEQQKEWFNSLDRTTFIPYLYLEIACGVCIDPVGYGILRSEEGVTLLTGGLLETERNDAAREKFDQPVALEVLNVNQRAYKLYTKLGFKPMYTTKRITYMELE
jgi:hypothetical protein